MTGGFIKYMVNKLSELSDDELYKKLQENLNDSDSLFQEIIARQEKQGLIKPCDPLEEFYSKKRKTNF